MKNILLTGAAGFIGSHVFDLLVNRYPDANFTIVDKMTYAASHTNIKRCFENINKYRLLVGDLADFAFTMDAVEGMDLVIHLAAESHVSRSFDNSMLFTKSNVLGTHNLIEACRLNQVNKVIHVSTDEVYGERTEGFFTERDPLFPTNPYAASKAAADMIINSYIKSFDMPIIILRSNNIYGIRQFPEKIIPRFILRSLSGLPLTVHGDGSNQRYYLSATDFSEAIYTLINFGKVGHIYNISSDQAYSNLEMAKIISSIVGTDHIDFVFTKDRPFNDSRYAVDDSKIKGIGWHPHRNLIDDLPKLIDWYRENQPRRELFTYID